MRSGFRSSLLILLILFPGLGALAAMPRAGASGSAPVVVQGRVIARLYTANAGLDPAARAALATRRLAALKELAAAEVETRPLREAVGVYARGQLLLVATPEEAATRGISPAALAQRWAEGLRKVLGGKGHALERTGPPGPPIMGGAPGQKASIHPIIGGVGGRPPSTSKEQGRALPSPRAT